MPLVNWSQVERVTFSPLIALQVIHAEMLTIARVFLIKGAVVAEHSHPNEQFTTLEKGRLQFIIEGQEYELAPGQSMLIPPDEPHVVRALEDSVAMDLFVPVREDWIRGDDAYLRG